MSKKKSKKASRHPGYIPPAEMGGKEKRIDTAEKIRAANAPRRATPGDEKYHPGA